MKKLITYLNYTLRLNELKKEGTHIKIIMVEKDSINLVTISDESNPSQYCDTIFSLKHFLKELNMFNVFIDFIPKFGSWKFFFFFLTCSFGNAR